MGTALNKPSSLSSMLVESLYRCSSSVKKIEEILGILQAPFKEGQPVELSNPEMRLTETIAVVETIEESLKRIERAISML